MPPWKKIPKAPYFLEIREGRFRTSYRVNFRGDGLDLRETLKGEFKDWRLALKAAERLISEKRFGPKGEEKSRVRSEELCDEIVQLKRSKARATYEQAEIFFRVHIKPHLNEHCPYAADLNPTVWLNYKNAKRIENPAVSLFNHWKFFVMLFRYAHQKGILSSPVRLEFNEKKEDHREQGQLISNEELKLILATANRTWRNRIVIQRTTGQRPGFVRALPKAVVDLESSLVRITAEWAHLSKNRRQYEFLLPAPAREALKDQASRYPESPYFFPMETDHSKPMDKHLGGWHGALRRAGIQRSYTPHDIRHVFLSERFRTSKNPALVCWACDLSLEEAMKTYVHFTAEDTRLVAAESEESARGFLG